MQDQCTPTDGDRAISEIIAELSEVFAFARTRWTKYAEEIDPALKGLSVIVLRTILRHGPVTATELSQMLDMDKATVSRQVARLRELDLVDAEASAEDRRVILLQTSQAARASLDRVHSQTAHDYHERFAGWSTNDLDRFRDTLRRFNGDASPASGVSDSPAARCARGHEAHTAAAARKSQESPSESGAADDE